MISGVSYQKVVLLSGLWVLLHFLSGGVTCRLGQDGSLGINGWMDRTLFSFSDIIIPTKLTWAQIYAWDGVTTKKAFVAAQISMSLRPNL